MDAVHIWSAELDVEPGVRDTLAASLSQEEHERASRYHRDRDRNRYLTAHGWLRRLLAVYVGVEAHAITFERGPRGKPRLAGSGRERLRFNHSRSAGRALYVLAHRADVGVDIQRLDSEFPVELIAGFLPSDDQERLSCLRDRELVLAFFEAWTRYEAIAKATGVGLAEPAEAVQAVSRCLVTTIDAGFECAAAVAVVNASTSNDSDQGLATFRSQTFW